MTLTTEQAIRELVLSQYRCMRDRVLADMTHDWDAHGEGCFASFILHLFPIYWIARARLN